jgi:hypothetical protein
MTGRPPLDAVERVPVLHNHVFATATEARDCGRGDRDELQLSRRDS